MSQVCFEINIVLFEIYSVSKHIFILLHTTDTLTGNPFSFVFINNTHDLEVTLCISDTECECVASETGDN